MGRWCCERTELRASRTSCTAALRSWAFTDRHAELGHAVYYDDQQKLVEVPWSVMPLQYWAGDPDTKEQRQAEFLVHDHFPWTAVEQIGVRDAAMEARVRAILASGTHQPAVAIRPAWYY